jgi:hypothetical protein
MNVEALIADFSRRGIRLIPNPPKLSVEPASKLTDQDREAIRAHKSDLLACLRQQQEEAEIDRLAHADGLNPDKACTLPPPGAPAYSILETCQCYGVALRIDAHGDLVVGKAGAKADESTQPWPGLLVAIEAHLEPIARLVEAGWVLKAEVTNREPA